MAHDKGGEADLYSLARKQAMIRRLIRMDATLIELVQDPIRSPPLDQIAFDLIIQAIDLDPFLFMADQVKQSFDRIGIVSGQSGASSGFPSAIVASLAKSSVPLATAAILAGPPNTDAKGVTTDDAISDDIVIAALKPIPGGRCSDQFVAVVRKEDRIAFYLALIDHLNFMNNALDYVGKNGQIVLSASWSGDKADRPLARNYTQSSLIKKLDGLAARMAEILNSQTQDALGCLERESDIENVPLSNFVHASDLFDTLGNYFEMKGRNFGAAAVPQVTELTGGHFEAARTQRSTYIATAGPYTVRTVSPTAAHRTRSFHTSPSTFEKRFATLISYSGRNRYQILLDWRPRRVT